MFAREGDIFEGSVCDWEAMKELILKGIFEAVQELDSFFVLDVPDVVISRVARMISAAEKARIRIDWLDCGINKISSGRDHAAWQIKRIVCAGRNRVAQLQEELGKMEEKLGEVRAEMALRNFCPGPMLNEKVYIIADL